MIFSRPDPYQSVTWFLEMIDGSNREGCLAILNDHRKLFEQVQGSTHNHQAWRGGYIDHVREVLNIADVLYKAMYLRRPLAFSLSDALLVLFLHDIEKPWKYQLSADGSELEIIPELVEKSAQHEFRMKRLTEYGIVLTDDQFNGLKYVEGELADYSSRHRVMGRLAGFCHMCDVASARVWFDYPLEKEDPWTGAQRDRS
jgi:hypothetical protein